MKVNNAKEFLKAMCDKKKKCPTCGKKTMYYNPSAGPIVGGVIMMKADKDGYVHPTEGAHAVGKWICLNCTSKRYKDD